MAQLPVRPAAGRMERLVARRETLLLGIVLVVAAGLRLYGLNWDAGHWLHPDERQIYFVTLGLDWPQSLAQALSTGSPLNPHFFAYGSLPFYLLKIVAALVAPFSPVLRDPDNLHLIGRPLAVAFDLGTVYLTYRLAGELQEGREKGNRTSWRPLLAAALAASAVMSIQIAHFYTADTLLVFFVMLALNLAVDVARGAGMGRQVALGAVVGLALATKVSAAPLALVVFVAIGLRQASGHRQQAAGGAEMVTGGEPGVAAPGTNLESRFLVPDSRLGQVAAQFAWTGMMAGAVFLLAQPYALIDWKTFVTDTVRESQIAWGALDVPYTRQYAGTLPYLYSMWQTALWGVGLPLGLAGWAGFGAALIRWLRRGSWADTLLLAWAGPYLAITGLFYARYLRYMLPLVPVLCIFAARLLAERGQETLPEPAAEFAPRQRGVRLARWSLIVVSLGYALLLASIYAVPHPWVTASKWIYRTVPAGSSLAVEEWDTPLPLPLNVGGRERRIEDYDVQVLPLYDEPDDAAKWSMLAADLSRSDYLVIASRRLYGSIPRLPDRYPLASRYYHLLFDGELGFQLAGEFTRGPGWLNPPVPPLADAIPTWLRPDESFVVYDHPRVLIFDNTRHLSATEIMQRINTAH